MPMYDRETLKTHAADSYKTATNNEAPVNVAQRFTYRYGSDKRPKTDPGRQLVDEKTQVTRDGLGSPVQGVVGKEWKTTIRFAPVDPASGDATEVEATVLGPDHKLGEEPHKDACKNAGTLNRAIGKSAQTGYIKGHLLNNNLGGPGNDDRNLAAIPRATNTGGMLEHVERRLKTMVNERKGWVYFKATCSFADWKECRYANKLEFRWHELKPDGAGDPEPVPSSDGTCVLDVPSPKHYDDTDYTQPTSGRTKGVTKTGKTSDTLDDATAVADVPWHAIVLDDWATVKLRKKIIDVTAGDLGKLTARGATRLVDYLCSAPGDAEVSAFGAMKREVERCGGDVDAVPDPKLEAHAKTYEAERSARIAKLLSDVSGFLTEKVGGDAGPLSTRLEEALRDGDPLHVYNEAIAMLLKRLEVAQRRLQDKEDELVYTQLSVMSPPTMDDLDEQLFPDEHKLGDVFAVKEKRVFERMTGSDEKDSSRKQARLLLPNPKVPRKSTAERWLEAFERVYAAPPLAELRRLDPSPGARPVHERLITYFEQSNVFVDKAFLELLMNGLAKKSDDFLAYNRQLKTIPALAEAFRQVV